MNEYSCTDYFVSILCKYGSSRGSVNKLFAVGLGQMREKYLVKDVY